MAKVSKKKAKAKPKPKAKVKKAPPPKKKARKNQSKASKRRLMGTVGKPVPGKNSQSDLFPSGHFQASGTVDAGIQVTVRLIGDGNNTPVDATVDGTTWYADFNSIGSFTPGVQLQLLVEYADGTSRGFYFFQEMPATPDITFTTTPAGNQQIHVQGTATNTSTLSATVDGLAVSDPGFNASTGSFDFTSDTSSEDDNHEIVFTTSDESEFDFTVKADTVPPTFDSPTSSESETQVQAGGTANDDGGFTDSSAVSGKISSDQGDEANVTPDSANLSTDKKSLAYGFVIQKDTLPASRQWTLGITATDAAGNSTPLSPPVNFYT